MASFACIQVIFNWAVCACVGVCLFLVQANVVVVILCSECAELGLSGAFWVGQCWIVIHDSLLTECGRERIRERSVCAGEGCV